MVKLLIFNCNFNSQPNVYILLPLICIS